MSSVLEKLSSNRIRLTITVDADTFEKGMQAAYRKNVGRLNVPGFRKGKAPRRVIENMYGEAIFYDDAINDVFPKAYEAAVKEHDLPVVDQPQVDVGDIEKGKELVFTAEVFVRPEVELGQYKGLKVKPLKADVPESAVEAEISRERERIASWESLDRPAETGDRANIDYEGSVDGVAFSGGTAKEQNLDLGSGTFIPGFEEQVVGMSAGEEKDISVTFPEEYGAKELAGKQAVFHVKVNSLQKKQLPALDDEFAKDVSEFDTYQAYEADVRAKLEKSARERAERDRDDELVKAACENAKTEIPEPMIEDKVNENLREMEMRMMYQGLRMEDYLKYTNQNMEDLRTQYRAESEKAVLAELVLEAVAKAESIQAEEDDVEAQIAKFAAQQGQTVDAFKENLNPNAWEYLGRVARDEKVLGLLRDSALETEEAEETDAAQGEAQAEQSEPEA